MPDSTLNPANDQSQVTDGAATGAISQNAKMGPEVNNSLANSATQPATPGMSGQPDPEPATSSQALADSEMSAGKGAVADGEKLVENKEVTPESVQPGAGESQEEQERKDHPESEPNDRYGGNFGNSVQGIYNDHDRVENQRSGASRGEFGTHGHGNTQGGYGNQYRDTDSQGNYDLRDGPQLNSYRNYNGRDDEYRPDHSQAAQDSSFSPESQGFQTNQNREGSTYLNDNGSGYGTDSGYSADYGHSSLGGAGNGAPDAEGTTTGQRNQHEDQNSDRGGYDNQDYNQSGNGQRKGREEMERTYDQPGGHDPDNSRGTYQQPSTQDKQADEAGRSGSGHGQGDYNGETAEGFGSKGGSYDDEYDSSDPNSKQGAPVRGDYDSTDKAQNYGSDQRPAYRADDQEDYGSAPRRNAARDEPNQ